jgi:hypothetical protein
MTDNERRRLEAFIRIRQFGADNAADFPAGSVGAVQFAVIDSVIDEVVQLAGEQAAGVGDSRQTFATKSTARENLRDELYDIARTARSMQYEFDGIEDKFRMPVNRSDQSLLATARAFHTESAAYDNDFQAYGLDKLFRAELQTATDAFEEALNPTGTAIDEQVASTAEIGDAIRRGMIARRILEAVVKNKYRANVGKLAAWLSASHIEKLAEGREPTPPAP